MIQASDLATSDILTITGAVANSWDGQRCIVPAWRRGVGNAVANGTSGDYDGGDRVIGFQSYEVDGDLLLTVGWGDGFGIRRINNDGTFTKLYHDTYALFRGTSSTYNHIMNIAIHKPSSTCVIATYNVAGYSMIDYSDLKAGGTQVNSTRPPSPAVFSTGGVTVDRIGYAYVNGMVMAGDWLYVGDYDATHYRKYPRRNMVTGAEELIDGTNTANIYTGAATIDRSGYRMYMAYDEVNDRVFYFSYYNANFMMIVDASTASPKCVWCDMADSGLGDDHYDTGLFIPDPVNAPNVMTVGYHSGHAHIDVTPCFSGSGPTVFGRFEVENFEKGVSFGTIFRSGTKYHSLNGDAHDKSLTHPEFNPTSSDRGKNQLDGWFDYDNYMTVCVYRHNNTVEDSDTLGRTRSYRSDYSSPIFAMHSANGTKYWVKVGYSYDGHGFYVWDDSIGPGLIGDWLVEYGTYMLDNSENISFVYLSKINHYTPSGCTLNYFVSNNNGSTWESYTPNAQGVHSFSSLGNQLRIKYVASGFEHKSPYKMASAYDSIMFGTMYEGIKQDLNTKVIKYRLSGLNI